MLKALPKMVPETITQLLVTGLSLKFECLLILRRGGGEDGPVERRNLTWVITTTDMMLVIFPHIVMAH